MSHPPFVDVKFYPGYSYQREGVTSFAPGRYVGLTRDGEVYVFSMDSSKGWVQI